MASRIDQANSTRLVQADSMRLQLNVPVIAFQLQVQNHRGSPKYLTGDTISGVFTIFPAGYDPDIYPNLKLIKRERVWDYIRRSYSPGRGSTICEIEIDLAPCLRNEETISEESALRYTFCFENVEFSYGTYKGELGYNTDVPVELSYVIQAELNTEKGVAVYEHEIEVLVASPIPIENPPLNLECVVGRIVHAILFMDDSKFDMSGGRTYPARLHTSLPRVSTYSPVTAIRVDFCQTVTYKVAGSSVETVHDNVQKTFKRNLKELDEKEWDIFSFTVNFGAMEDLVPTYNGRLFTISHSVKICIQTTEMIQTKDRYNYDLIKGESEWEELSNATIIVYRSTLEDL